VFIQIDLSNNGASIQDVRTLTEFEIRSQEINAEQTSSLIGGGSYVKDESHVWVSINWILENIKEEVNDDWNMEFNKMIAYAKTKGWVNEKETHLQAHIEPTG